jgi:Glycerol dehydrogenase and related enzymes
MITEEKMHRAFASPSKYIQGWGIVDEIQKYSDIFGNSVYSFIDEFFWNSNLDNYKTSFESDVELICTFFSGEITTEKVRKEADSKEVQDCDVVVGIGGGKSIDGAKWIADKTRKPLIVIPTLASCDAPCSALSIIYSEDKSRDVHVCRKNPDIVLVDTKIISKAPVRFLIAGMGDALATYFEADANQKTASKNFIMNGYYSTNLASSVAELCYKVIMRDGFNAIRSIKSGVCTNSLENVIEANILLSGLGFENTGCAGAHSISSGISYIPECAKLLHGEKVAFGTLCQLVIEGRVMSEIEKLIHFYMEIGLPVTFKDLGIIEITDEKIMLIAEKSIDKYWYAEPVKVDTKSIFSNIKLTNEIGEYYKQHK